LSPSPPALAASYNLVPDIPQKPRVMSGRLMNLDMHEAQT